MFGFDSLLYKCKNLQSKSLINESIKAYHSGVYRGAIVLCWNAIVVDFEGKLEQLKTVGDQHAEAMLNNYRDNRDKGIFNECNRFEEELLKESVNFEIISKQEQEILERLKKDRNRSAHPGFLPESDESVVLPELTRSHITNALQLYLSRSPFFSKRAADLINQQVSLELFGQEKRHWEEWFELTGLKNIRENSIKGLCGYLMFNVFEKDEQTAEKYKNVLQAYLHVDNTRWSKKTIDIFNETIKKYHKENSCQQRIFWLVQSIPQLGSAIPNESWTWLKGYAMSNLYNVELWRSAYNFKELKNSLLKINNIPENLLELIIDLEKDRLFVTKILIDQYTKQSGYRPAADKGQLLFRFVDVFKENLNLIDKLVEQAKQSPGNSIFGSDYFDMIVFKELAKDIEIREKLKQSFDQNSLNKTSIFNTDVA